ncbi:MAG: glycosyltransferase involved in cell wall biosynthesis [Glaciecola sp.]|jgi:glycosyltransferase involved in cell wall biosynthesis
MSQHKKKICFATGEFFPTVGGLSKSATRIAEMLGDSGFEMHVIVPIQGKASKSGVVPEKLNSVLIYRVPVGDDVQNTNGSPLVKVIRQLDQELNFDLFHGFFLSMAYACCLGMNKIVRPLISSIRGSDAKKWTDPSMNNLLRLVIKKTNCLTTVNTVLLSNVLKSAGIEVDSMFIKNSIGLHSNIIWNIDTMTQGKIGTLGKFQKCKEIDILIDSYNNVDAYLRSNLMLIGNFPNNYLKTENENKIEFLKLKGEVVLTGFLDETEVVQNLKDLNVFVSTSSSEGFPNALLEAASLGVPIVVAGFEGIEDYCENGKNALIVPIGDVKATTNAISSILMNKELAQHLSNGAINLAKSLTPDIEKKQWVQVYKAQIEKDFKNELLRKNICLK